MRPFAVIMAPSGDTACAPDCDDHDCDSLIDRIESLRGHLRAAARDGDLRAGAIVYIASVQNRDNGKMQDAVAINLSHRDALSTVVYYPFECGSGGTDWGDCFQQAGRSDIFQ